MTGYLTDAAKRQILQSRIQSWALDAYGHQLNKAAAGDDLDAIAAADDAIVVIGSTIAIYEAELALIPAPVEETVIDLE